MAALERRAWVPESSEDYVQRIAGSVHASGSQGIAERIDALIAQNREIHEHQCVNLNPATNVMNPCAEAVLSQALGSRASLGYPGEKYEMGLEAIEQIEIIAAELAAEIFDARFAEVRVASGAMSNLYAFMATTQPGDKIVVPPASIGGHVTHHRAGAAGLYGLEIFEAPLDGDRYTVDLEALETLVLREQPRLITIGGSLNLFPHPVAQIRAIADQVGAYVLFDAAHQCGMIASKVWSNPLADGAHLMTMSTYKSLGGPAGGLIVTNDEWLAERLDQIAYPGLTANFDAAKTAALAVGLLDWRDFGPAYGRAMVATARALASSLEANGLPVYSTTRGITSSHQFAVRAASWGGGQAASKKLRQANILASGIGLPIEAIEGDMNGLRLGSPEIVRWGMAAEDMPELADLALRALEANDASVVAVDTTNFRKRFSNLAFVRDSTGPLGCGAKAMAFDT